MPASPGPWRRAIFLILLTLVTTGLMFLALVIPFAARLSETALRVGDVATQEILAPYNLTFESQVLTDNQRENAIKSVRSVFSPADPNVGRKQLEGLRSALSFITSVRADTFATPDQQLSDLATLEGIRLPGETALDILGLSDGRWQTVQQEAIVVLEQVMRNTIRTDQLETARQSLPALVTLSLTSQQAAIVVELSNAFVAANSFFDETATQNAIQKARDAVEPVERTFIANEVIIQRGQVMTDIDVEALTAFNLPQSPVNWQDLVSAIVLPVLITAFFIVYISRHPVLAQDIRAITIGAILLLVFLFVGRMTIPGHTVLPYLFPVAAFGLTLAALFGIEFGLFAVLPLGLLLTFGLPNALDLSFFYIVSSSFGILVLRRGHRLTLFFWAAVAIAISGSMVVIAYRLPQPTTDWVGLATLSGVSSLNGAVSAGVGILLQYALAQFLGRVTALQLVELSRPDHPLLKFILTDAPGTYQHSLQVASLAEQAAERIGADALLTRVGAMFHDAGKAKNPGFFIENQLAGAINPHHNIPHQASAEIIIQHVAEGLELARKYRLPRQIQAFITEHHGTQLTRYQYVSAVEAAGGDESQVDKNQFRYPGPRPQSRETALLMLADGCEARVRADRPKDEDELRTVIRAVIDDRIKNGQLEDTELTLKDLQDVVSAFVASLRGVYHPRIQYPTLEKPAQGETVPPERPTKP